MTTIYVDHEAVSASRPGGSGVPEEAAIRSLGFLREAGHDVVIVADLQTQPKWVAAGGDWQTHEPGSVPIRPVEQAWYLTTHVERCRGRSALLRTVLIGLPPARSAVHRCDGQARDVSTAVLEILAAEAMRP